MLLLSPYRRCVGGIMTPPYNRHVPITAGHGSRSPFSFLYRKENKGVAAIELAASRCPPDICIQTGSTPSTTQKTKRPPDGWSFGFGAGYGSRTRLHGLGSRCITDIRILHCVGIIAKAGRNFNTYFVDGQKQTKDFPISISLSSPYKMYCSYPARYGVS